MLVLCLNTYFLNMTRHFFPVTALHRENRGYNPAISQDGSDRTAPLCVRNEY